MCRVARRSDEGIADVVARTLVRARRRRRLHLLENPPELDPGRANPSSASIWVQSRFGRIVTRILNGPIEVFLIADDAIERLLLPEITAS
jgi:hypothetical protein